MLLVFHRNLDITEQQTSRAESAIFKVNQSFMNIRLCTKMGSHKTLFILYVLTILVIIYTILITTTHAVKALGKPYLTAVLQVHERGGMRNQCPRLS